MYASTYADVYAAIDAAACTNGRARVSLATYTNRYHSGKTCSCSHQRSNSRAELPCGAPAQSCSCRHSDRARNSAKSLAPWSSGAARGRKGGKLPPYGWTSKNYVIRVCFHCHGTSSYHTTNTLQGRRANSHVDTQTIQPGLGDFVL